MPLRQSLELRWSDGRLARPVRTPPRLQPGGDARLSTHRARTATSSVSTGTPRAIFTRTSASKGLYRSRARARNLMQQFLHRLLAANKLHRALRPERGRSRQNHHVAAGTDSWNQSDDRIIFRQRGVRRTREVGPGLARLGMFADDRKITLTRPRRHSLKNEFLRAGNVEQRKIF